MRRTIKTRTATIAAALVVACLLPYTTADSFGYPRNLKSATEQASFDMPVAAPIAFLTLTHDFKAAAVGRVSFNMPAAAPVTSSASPVRRQVNARQIDSGTPSPTPAAFYSLPRRLEATVDRISFSTASLAPMAFVRFCMQYPKDCKVRRMEFRPKPVALTEARKAELAKVNRDVNRAIRPRANNNGVMAEEWLVSPRDGDCNDYAVTKRHELLARGWPSRSLLLAEVVVPSGEHHLVLVVRTREEDVVLDNLNWNIRAVSQIRYRWVRAQRASNPKFWSTINVTPATRVALHAR